MPCVVVSAVNFTEGGPLTVLRECLEAAVAVLPPAWEVVALVNSAELISDLRVRSVAIPSAKRSWFLRLYWEWIGFSRVSRHLRPILWFSLHDITPRVSAVRQVVYCHNPAPFYRIGFREATLDPRFLMFNKFYALLYWIRIRRNAFIVVQQEWLREEFERRFGKVHVVVAYPIARETVRRVKSVRCQKTCVFFYPALPRVFKNFETLCEAARVLSLRKLFDFEVRLTIDGDENRYARWLRSQFGSVPEIKFIGRLTKDEMALQYREAAAVVFPSKLETWGLPISEGKAFGKALLLADLPYAREAVGNYDLAGFFPANSAAALAGLMQAMGEGTWQPAVVRTNDPSPPFARDWTALWEILTEGLIELPRG